MKKFLKKRLLGIPVIALLIVALTAGAVMAAYPVITGTVSVEVKEAFTVQYKSVGLGVSDWTDAPANFNIDVKGAYPGECVGIEVKVINASGSPLLATVSIVPRSDGWLVLDAPSSLFSPAGLMVPANGNVERSFTACVEDDAAPNTYTIDITVSRG